MKVFLAIAALLLLLPLVGAEVFTVSPGESIQEAIELAQPGDTVELKDGEYTEDLVTVRDGEPDKRITLSGGRGAVLKGTGKESRLFQIHHSYTTVDGFVLDGKIGKGDKAEHYVDKGIYAHGNRETRVIRQYGEEFRSAIDGLIISNMKIINFGGECTRFRYFVTNLEFFGSHLENCGVYDFVFNGMKSVNGETIYLGTSSNQISDGKNPSDEIDQTRFIHIHHNVFKGLSNEVDAKEGAQYILVEENQCSTQKDPNSGCVDSRSDYVVFRYNQIHSNDGAGVRIGGHEVNGKQWGLNNEVYGNTFYGNKEGALKLQTGQKEHPHLCENTCKGGCEVSGSASEGNEDMEKKCSDLMPIFWVDDTKAAPDAVSVGAEASSIGGEPDDAADADTREHEPEADFDAAVEGRAEPKQSGKCFPVPIADVKASSEDGKHTVHAAIDGKALTRWSSLGKGEWLEIDLASPQKIDAIEMSFFKGDERTQSFEVAVDGKNILQNQESNGKTLALERFPFPKAVDASSSVTIEGGGNSQNDWNSMTEVIVCGAEEQQQKSQESEDGLCSTIEKLDIGKVSASVDDGKDRAATSVIDGDLKTRWETEGPEEQHISVDLGKPMTVTELGLAVFEGDKIKQFFDVLVETEEHGWEEVVIDGESLKSNGIESYDIGMKGVTTVKVVCYGSEDLASGEGIERNSFTEIELYGCV
ncbi:EsV-1-164 [Ectocarpus siliculosus]|uniref:EsV-1-164 n=1 Tax=Ectocarpus siliculosus TaxID=2880 RepID=D8LPI3_ECTSI|nr:EsV-1-164 [Ectocarpus siliculosus]|eukprot:CBN80455.1 EsV-1-164 [Ectocarpus siliculosus]